MKKMCVTIGKEEIVAKRYKEISGIIKSNTKVSIKTVIKKIAGISMGAWYNCIMKGKHFGKVSNKTVNSLAKFFNISEKVFSGHEDFTPEHKKVIEERIKTEFAEKQYDKKDVTEKEVVSQKKEKKIKIAKVKIAGKYTTKDKSSSSIENKLKEFATEIDSINDIKQLVNLPEIFNKLSNLAQKKIEFLTAVKECF